MVEASSHERALAAVFADLGALETSEEVIAAARSVAAVGIPLPAGGVTAERFRTFADIAARDLALARIIEGHADAIAILHEAGIPAKPGLYGVWAAGPGVISTHRRLRGRRKFCSGATGLDRALVTADDGVLYDVALSQRGVVRHEGTWQAVGMATTDSLDVTFESCVAEPVGPAGFYLQRPGFWHGAVGVAACWFGGARGAMEMLRERSMHVANEHQLAHLGAVIATCTMMETQIEIAAHEIDCAAGADPGGQRRALIVRHLVERGCQEVLERVGRAGGTSPLVFDRAHAKRAADLVVYLRQHHAEADLAALARIDVRR